MTALGNKVLIKHHPDEETTSTGILLPNSAKTKPKGGVVLSVGEKVKTIKVGDTIAINKYAGSEIKIDGNTCSFVTDADVLGIIKE